MMAMFRVVSLGITIDHNLEAAICGCCPTLISLHYARSVQKGDRYSRGIITFHVLALFTAVDSSASDPCTQAATAAATAGKASRPGVDYGIHRQDGNRRPSFQVHGHNHHIQRGAKPILYGD